MFVVDIALAENKNIFILGAVVSKKQRGSQKPAGSRAGPGAGEGAARERGRSDREAALHGHLTLLAASSQLADP